MNQWPKEKEEYLKASWGAVTVRDIAIKLGKSRLAVYQKAGRMGLESLYVDGERGREPEYGAPLESRLLVKIDWGMREDIDNWARTNRMNKEEAVRVLIERGMEG